MTDVLTTVFGFVKQTIGGNRNTWGGILNNNFDLVEAALAGKTDKVVTGAGDVTLSDTERRNRVLNFTGTLTANQTIIVANLKGRWIVNNDTDGDFALTMKTASGDPVEIPQDAWVEAWCDGNDVIRTNFGASGYALAQAETATAARTILDAARAKYGKKPGEIFVFGGPAQPADAYECDGSAKSRTTDEDLFNALTVQADGTRASTGNGIISGITGVFGTGNMRVGYYASGTGIASGRRIASIDSATQITLDGNNTSTGTSAIVVSPYPLGDGTTTFNIPDYLTSGRFIRSRTASVPIGTYQSHAFEAHAHPGSTISIDSGGTHTHAFSATSDPGSAHAHSIIENTNAESSHTHSVPMSFTGVNNGSDKNVYTNGSANPVTTGAGSSHLHGNTFTSGTEGSHTHAVIGTTQSGGAHVHTGTVTVASQGGTETRPNNGSAMICIQR